jgi:hypothetical protein
MTIISDINCSLHLSLHFLNSKLFQFKLNFQLQLVSSQQLGQASWINKYQP